MASTRTIDVSFSLTGEASTRGTAALLARSPLDRVGRAALIVGAMWLLAGVCVFIPILHFVLVPGFAVVGVVLAIVRLRDNVSLMGANGVCPRCKVPRTFKASGRFKSSSTVHCEGCGCQLTVVATPA